MIAGLATVLLAFHYTSVAFTWYVMIGSCVTFAVGALVSRVLPETPATLENTNEAR